MLDSGNGNYYLLYQSDGNLVLYDWSWSPVWAQPGAVGDPDEAVMQEDGNFVVYSAAVWSTQTDDMYNKGAYLVVQNDGNVVVYHLDGRVPKVPTAIAYAHSNRGAYS